MIGIIAAMQTEIDNLIKKMKNTETESISGINYTKGILKDKECVLSISGVGKVNAAVAAQTMILEYSPKVIINIGVAGSLSDDVNICDIVIGENVIQHDMDTSPIGDPKGYISGIGVIEISSSKKLNDLIIGVIEELNNIKYHKGNILTGDQFIAGSEMRSNILSSFDGIACEMEGGAIGQVCYMNNVPFAVIRSISDNANDKAHISYDEFLGIAVRNTHLLIMNLIPKL